MRIRTKNWGFLGSVFLVCLLWNGSAWGAYPYSDDELRTKRTEALTWVDARRNGGDWVAATETADFGYTYDNALMVIAYVMGGDAGSAVPILDFLAAHQLPDGSWYDAVRQATGAGIVLARSSGNQAWAIYAICVYTDQTGDFTYLPVAHKAASWLIARQDLSDGGVTGGLNSDGTVRPWTSTEHNIDAYFALKLLYRLSRRSEHWYAMNRCKSWLLNVAWNAAEGRFNRGENDTLQALDANTLGSLFLHDIGEYAKEASAIAHLDTYWLLTERFRRGKRVRYEGFKDHVLDEEGNPGRHWQEGTEQAAVSYLRRGQGPARYYIQEVVKSDDPNFLIGHSDDDNDGDRGLLYYMTGDEATGLVEKPAPGIWMIFAINEYLGDREKIFYPVTVTPPPSGGEGKLPFKLTP